MKEHKITIETVISADKAKVWDYYTNPKHIVNWNFASDDWCCPKAENDLKIGGVYNARMEAKDGSFGFDFKAIYSVIKPFDLFSYNFENRVITVNFEALSNGTKVTIAFDPETQNSIEMQRNGWQAILNNFKKYTELN